MNTTHHFIISDELLVRFIDDKTTPEETNFVLEAMKNNPELYEEYHDIIASLMLKTEPPIDFMEENIKLNQPKKQTARYWFIAASIILIVGIVAFFTIIHTPKNEIIYVQDETVTETDSAKVLLVEEKNIEEKSSQHSTTETIEEENELQMMQPKKNKNMATQNSLQIKSFDDIDIICNYEKNTLEFNFNSDVEKLVIVLSKKNGIHIIKKEVEGKKISFSLSDYEKYKEINWEVEAFFSSGAVVEKRGSLYLK